MDEIERMLREIGATYRKNVAGSSLTTFGSGGSVAYVVTPKSEEELRVICLSFSACGVPHRVIGGGSNLLLPDEGYDGVLIKMAAFRSIERVGSEWIVGAGVKMPILAREAMRCALSGVEFASGIPGEAGGAVKGNAGAFGQMLSDVLTSVTIMTSTGKISTLSAQDLDLGYHTSALPKGAIVLSLRLRLSPDISERIAARIAEMRDRRRATQPTAPSAGSVFRRAGAVPAALYIERTGLKGMRIGGAELSEKHCNFIVNRGGATTGDFFALAEKVRDSVKAVAGVTLAYEVERVCSKSEN